MCAPSEAVYQPSQWPHLDAPELAFPLQAVQYADKADRKVMHVVSLACPYPVQAAPLGLGTNPPTSLTWICLTFPSLSRQYSMLPATRVM